MMRIAPLLLIPFLLAGCDVVKDRMGIKDPAKVEAEAKAIGASCRLSGRGLEDCYSLNESYPKAPIYAGWKEMNEYMAQRNMEAQPPQVDETGKAADAAHGETAKEPAKETAKGAAKEATPAKDAAKEPAKDAKPKSDKEAKIKLPDLAKEAAAAKH
ncbi:MAG: hypothetical protein HXY26_08515 [Hydrogenophilaceae bacterium]|nr:hypothetical protein [Hydrogenophilaceae bacterium]